ncbi:starvation-inducible DNA-binding protein [Thermosporothrix hazakensis]|uniref:Starvation-inducible DNA-binding protein n=2 Tax=Thermosporothrix TaxID=768650 RepID=A0A326UND6_THEHA|nr:DNA starvation/stationary phase protection protein [Thermosporothrix hazakensis]PZW35879.1 starvation-inducible DNA-binding protein [Thermosporothrix hazakensis]BBH88345.1 DNA starvation/stationary phase protection protein [Thermosporothrix sp. COM3]GCE46532.1 DNA starvation/stationary phase protection protein [Thermosporothrix hazakensis]
MKPSQTTTTITATPKYDQRSVIIQRADQVHSMPIGLSEQACSESCKQLNLILADSIMLYNMYKKHHWQMSGPTFYQLHLLMDKHANEILKTIDLVAERIQTLGGVSIGMPHDIVEITNIERPPKDEEDVPAMLSRLIRAQSTVIDDVRKGIEITERNKDYGTNDMLMSEVLRTHEMHIWFVSEHLVDTPLIGEESNGQRK